MRLGSLCSGYGGLDLAVQDRLGAELAWWSDIEPGPIAVMSTHTDAPNIGDLKEVDWSSVEPIDILTAGYPCQPFSNAGKRLGTEDPRHLWPWIERAIGALRPQLVILENVAGHLRRGFDIVLSDLTALGYDVRWSVVRASDAGAPHRRERLYVVAQDTNQQSGLERWSPASGEEESWRTRADPGRRSGVLAADSEGVGRRERGAEHARLLGQPDVARSGCEIDWGEYGPAIDRWAGVTGRVAPNPTVLGRRGSIVLSPFFVEWMMGLPEGWVTSVPDLTRNQQLRLLGNGVVPQQAALAIDSLLGVT